MDFQALGLVVGSRSWVYGVKDEMQIVQAVFRVIDVRNWWSELELGRSELLVGSQDLVWASRDQLQGLQAGAKKVKDRFTSIFMIVGAGDK